jgi:hypothetical protein
VLTFTYDGTEDEMNRIISEQTDKGLVLLQVANITEGNFLRFNETVLDPLPPLDITGAVVG